MARRDHASTELQRKLCDKGYDSALIERLVEQLRTEKLVDDHRFLESFVAYHASRGHGPVWVRGHLHRIGLTGAHVDRTIFAFADWLAELRKARGKKFGVQLPTDYAERQRQVRFLAYRGFTTAQIRMALGFDTDLNVDTDLDVDSEL